MNGGGARLLGRWGEAVAAEDLRRKGWRLVAAGWQCRFGEIDLIAENSKYITFIEVKLRKNADFAPARAAVDRRSGCVRRRNCISLSTPRTFSPGLMWRRFTRRTGLRRERRKLST